MCNVQVLRLVMYVNIICFEINYNLEPMHFVVVLYMHTYIQVYVFILYDTNNHACRSQ